MRLQNWQERFSEFGKARASMPFEWGANDCCTFAADAVQAITGRDVCSAFPMYDGALSAVRAIEQGGGLHQLATEVLGASVSPRMAAVGDVVLFINEGREMMGICNGTGVLAPGERGMEILGMDTAMAAWRI